eukprot:tig00000057_g100.t1
MSHDADAPGAALVTDDSERRVLIRLEPNKPVEVGRTLDPAFASDKKMSRRHIQFTYVPGSAGEVARVEVKQLHSNATSLWPSSSSAAEKELHLNDEIYCYDGDRLRFSAGTPKLRISIRAAGAAAPAAPAPTKKRKAAASDEDDGEEDEVVPAAKLKRKKRAVRSDEDDDEYDEDEDEEEDEEEDDSSPVDTRRVCQCALAFAPPLPRPTPPRPGLAPSLTLTRPTAKAAGRPEPKPAPAAPTPPKPAPAAPAALPSPSRPAAAAAHAAAPGGPARPRIVVLSPLATGPSAYDPPRSVESLCAAARAALARNAARRIVVAFGSGAADAAALARCRELSPPSGVSFEEGCTLAEAARRAAEGAEAGDEVAVVVETNWRFKAPPSTPSHQLVQAIGAATFESEAKRLHGVGVTGRSYIVPVPPGASLPGVAVLIAVVPPNMNPQRPDCLPGYDAAEPLLRAAYDSAMAGGASSSSPDHGTGAGAGRVAPKNPGPAAGGADPRPAASAPSASTSSSAGPAADPTYDAPASPERYPGDRRMHRPGVAPVLDGPPPEYKPPPPEERVIKPEGGWNETLVEIAQGSKRFLPLRYYFERDITVAYDAYPKARRHLLVMPRFLLRRFKDLRREHLPLLRRMLKVGRWIADGLRAADASLPPFLIGFHASPSLDQVHMHVISSDLESDCVKDKKHWNSFTTEFLVPPEELIALLEQKGAVQYDKDRYEALLKKDLACNRCGKALRNMPELKAHIAGCRPRPAE